MDILTLGLPSPKNLPPFVERHFPRLSAAACKTPILGACWAQALLEAWGIPFTEDKFFEKVRVGEHRVVETFLSAGIRPDARDVERNTALIIACANGDVRMVRLILDRLCRLPDFADNINWRNLSGVSAVFAAYVNPSANSREIRQMLADSHALEEHLEDADLLVAVKRSDAPAAAHALDRGGNPNRKDLNHTPALLVALKQGSGELAILLIQRGADVNATGPGLVTALMLASDKGLAAVVRTLLERGCDKDAKDASGRTALSYAIAGRHPEIEQLLSPPPPPLGSHGSRLLEAAQCGNLFEVQRLIDSGGDLNIRDADNNTPLMLAAARGWHNIVGALLDARAEPEARNCDGDTALIQAARHGRLAAVEVLLPRCITPGASNNAGNTALIEAARTGYNAIVHRLLQNQAPIDHANHEGQTALMLAAANQHVLVVETLLSIEPRADVNWQDKYHCTALIEACHAGSVRIVRMLLQYEADKNAVATYGCTPWMAARLAGHTGVCELLGNEDRSGVREAALFEAARHGHTESVRQILVAGDVNADAMDMSGHTALMEAAERGYYDIVQLLLDQGHSDANRRTRDGRTCPLCLSASHGRKAALEALIPHLTRGEELDKQVSRAAIWATRNGHAEVVRVLVSRLGASTNTTDDHDRTLLHLAAAQGHTTVVETLLKLEPNLDAEDAQGNTPMMTALLCGHPHLAVLLNAHSSSQEVVARIDGARLIAAARRGNRRLFKLLLERCADIDTRDSQGMTALMIACEKGHHGIAGDLLRRLDKEAIAGQLQAMDDKGRTPLIWAAIGADAFTMRLLLRYNPSVCGADGEGWTALYWAIERGHEPLALKLIAHQANVRSPTKTRRTPLMAAARRGQNAVVEAILGKFTNDDELRTYLNLTDDQGHSALKEALIHEHEAIANLLQQRGAVAGWWDGLLFAAAKRCEVGQLMRAVADRMVKVDTHDEANRTPLMVAAIGGCNGGLRVLIDAGADVNAVDCDGRSALSFAALGGHILTVSTLVNSGANVNISDRHGCTPLIEATVHGHKEVVNTLMDNHANPNIKDSEGRFPLMLATLAGAADIVEGLVRQGEADKDAGDPEGRTPLMMAYLDTRLHETKAKLLELGARRGLEDAKLILAARNGSLADVQELVNHGANAAAADIDGNTALMEAARYGHPSIVDALVRVGAPINARNRQRRTALMEAARGGHLGVVRALFQLRTEVHIDARDENKDTALHEACRALEPAGTNRYLEIVNLLVEHNAHLQARNTAGRTPLMEAAEHCHLVIVKRLIDALTSTLEINLRVALLTLDNKGKTAWDLATANHCVQCSNAIQEALERATDRGGAVIVGTTRFGESYHYQGCGSVAASLARGEFEQKTVEQALAEGYAPCRRPRCVMLP